jgi:hypothetical protein
MEFSARRLLIPECGYLRAPQNESNTKVNRVASCGKHVDAVGNCFIAFGSISSQGVYLFLYHLRGHKNVAEVLCLFCYLVFKKVMVKVK